MTSEYEYWVGIDLAGASQQEICDFNAFYDEIHVREVLRRNEGFIAAHRYEQIAGDPGGTRLPHWLAVYEIRDAEALERYQETERSGHRLTGLTPGPAIWRDKARRQTTWRVVWRAVSGSGSAPDMPPAIYLNGMDAPDATSDAALREFNDFYDRVHVPEVLAYRKSRRARRYELQVQQHSSYGQPLPRFVAIYDVSSQQADAVRDGTAPPRNPDARFTRGPRVWESRVSCWRVYYRHLSSFEAEEQ